MAMNRLYSGVFESAIPVHISEVEIKFCFSKMWLYIQMANLAMLNTLWHYAAAQNIECLMACGLVAVS